MIRRIPGIVLFVALGLFFWYSTFRVIPGKENLSLIYIMSYLVFAAVIREMYKQVDIWGIVTLSGLQRNAKKKEIPLESIAKITGFFSICFPFVKELYSVRLLIHMPGGYKTREISLRAADMAGIARTRLNQWVVDNGAFEMTPGAPGSMMVVYEPVGKYAGEASVRYLLYWLAPIYAVLLAFDLVAIKMLAATFFGIVGLFLALRAYSKVSASVDAGGVTLREDGEERFLSFTDITKVERGLLRVKVTGRGGEELYFPKAFCLLPELIEEFAG